MKKHNIKNKRERERERERERGEKKKNDFNGRARVNDSLLMAR